MTSMGWGSVWTNESEVSKVNVYKYGKNRSFYIKRRTITVWADIKVYVIRCYGQRFFFAQILVEKKKLGKLLKTWTDQFCHMYQHFYCSDALWSHRKFTSSVGKCLVIISMLAKYWWKSPVQVSSIFKFKHVISWKKNKHRSSPNFAI